MLYQIYDCTDDLVKTNHLSFEQAKENVAITWVEDEAHWNKIMASQTLDELNNYAEGLGYIVERMDEK